MLRVGIFGKTDSARRKAEIVLSSSSVMLVGDAVDLTDLIEASDLVVLADGDAMSRTAMATNVLRRGRHVFSDWPLAVDGVSAKLLSRTAEESGVELAVNRPDRLHPSVLALRDKSPTLTDVTLSAGRHYRFDNLVTDAIDLCLFLNGNSGVHRYEAEAVRDEAGAIGALSFALRFHSGSLAVGHIRKGDSSPTRTIFAAGSGWQTQEELVSRSTGSPTDAYDPSVDERSFISCLDRIGLKLPVTTSLYDLAETIRSVENIMSRTRGKE